MQHFVINKAQVENTLSTMDHKILTLATKEQLANDLGETKRWFNRINEANSKKSNCLKDKKEIEDCYAKLTSMHTALADEHAESRKRLIELETKIILKVDKVTLDRLQTFIDVLPTQEEINHLKGYLRDNINFFSVQNKDFNSKFEEHLAIIRRYDEVISEKANKHALTEMELRVNDNFKPIMQMHD